jgi:hypothetical protein
LSQRGLWSAQLMQLGFRSVIMITKTSDGSYVKWSR